MVEDSDGKDIDGRTARVLEGRSRAWLLLPCHGGRIIVESRKKDMVEEASQAKPCVRGEYVLD